MATKKNSEPETLQFDLHPAILWSIIKEQAGTLMKAIQEGVQNSVDSGSSRCDITLTKDKVTIVDDGRGFSSREEIMKNFKTFGTPHVEGDATYGKYRMGRGQMFSFGLNRWYTQGYLLTVDIKPQEGSEKIGFSVSESSPPVAGCYIDIDLYDKLRPSEVDAVERELKRFLKFVQIPVSLNGTVINSLPKDRKWGLETDEAYFDLKDTGNLDVYNMGVLIRSYPASQFGAGGTVVSKSQIGINFARNDIQSSCPIFKRIAATIRKTAVKGSTKKKRLTNAEWEAVANDVRVGDTDLVEVFSTPLVKLVTGSMISFSDLRSRLEKYHNRIAVAAADDHMGDRLMQNGVALVVDKETLSRFGYDSLKDFCGGIAGLAQKAAESLQGTNWQSYYKVRNLGLALDAVKIIDREEFGKYVNMDYADVPVAKLNAAEKFALDVLKRASQSIGSDIATMVSTVRSETRYHWNDKFNKDFPLSVCQTIESLCGKNRNPVMRDIRVGECDSADAWTDGEAVIWINRDNLRLIGRGIPGLTRIAELMLHEYIHQSPSTGNLNVHNLEFYQAHHDLAVDTPIIGRAVNIMMDRSIKLIRNEKRKPTGALLRFEDQMSELTDAGVVAAAASEEPEAEVADAFPEAIAAAPSAMR